MPSLFGSKFKRKGGYYIKGGGYMIPFDLVLSESHTMEAEIAEHVMEGDVSAISTHIHNKLRSGELEGLVSNYSLSDPLFIGSGLLRMGLGTSPTGPNRAQSTLDLLRQLWELRVPVEIIMILNVYSSVCISRITVDRNSKNGDAQTFRIAFKEVRRVSLKETTIKVGVSADGTTPADKQAAPPVDAGKQ